MKILFMTWVAALLALPPLAQGQDKDQEREKRTKKDEPVVISLMTVTFAESTGCWVKIYDDHDYQGRTLTLVGQQSLPNLEFGVGYDWEGDIDSLIVGPKAKLTLYEDEDYADKKRELGPGEKVKDLHKTVFDEGVESLRLNCIEG